LGQDLVVTHDRSNRASQQNNSGTDAIRQPAGQSAAGTGALHAVFPDDGCDLDFFLVHAEQQYFEPGETLVEPASGEVTHLFFIRQGAVSGKRGLADLQGGAFQYETGDLFPISAAIASGL